MKRFLKIVERLAGYAILLAMIVAVVMIVGQPQTTGGNQEAFSARNRDQIRKKIEKALRKMFLNVVGTYLLKA